MAWHFWAWLGTVGHDLAYLGMTWHFGAWLGTIGHDLALLDLSCQDVRLVSLSTCRCLCNLSPSLRPAFVSVQNAVICK